MTYTTSADGTYGLLLSNWGEGRAELTLFFDDAASEEMRFHFEEYVQAHLYRKALPESIQRRRTFACPGCRTPFTDVQVTRRLNKGKKWIICSVCDTKVMLLDKKERLMPAIQSLVSEMDHAANIQRDRTATEFIRESLSSTRWQFMPKGSQLDFVTPLLKEKMKRNDFDVFLCHTRTDKPEVKKIGQALKDHGILPWLDEWALRPGLPWQRLLEQQIGQIKSAAVFVGKSGIGPWQQEELDALLRVFVERGCPIIPVLLPSAPREPEIPRFLQNRTWVDFRKLNPDPIEHLIWGITGERVHFY